MKRSMSGNGRLGPPTRPGPISSSNAAYLEPVFRQYQKDPDSVDAEWRRSFDSLSESTDSILSPSGRSSSHDSVDSWGPEDARKQSAVLRLINAYRTRGHQIAEIDPLGRREIEMVEDFELGFQGLAESDLDLVFDTGSLFFTDQLRLKDIIGLCREVYCGSLGIEYMYITRTEEKRWLQCRLETMPVRPVEDPETRCQILERLIAAEGLEHYLHRRYVGQKRFSLEGGESLIPLLGEVIQQSGSVGVKEVVIGMTHRGRLNAQINILGKAPGELFDEFDGHYISASGDTDTGDVKYHQGFSTDIQTPGGPVHVALSFNPSHLEIIGPVVEGSVRARQQRRAREMLESETNDQLQVTRSGSLNTEHHRDDGKSQVLPLLIHGDAAFAGQGVVMETLNMSNTRGFSTGGTIHVIINNQIGFTTSNPLDARSTHYCTEVAKMVQAPILHVNGDDPDAVLYATRLAHDFRLEFNKDVVIDLIGYRRLGHNEADEPSMTQPVMYARIAELPTVCTRYTKRLVEDGVISQPEADKMATDYRAALDQGHVVANQVVDPNKAAKMVDWTPYVAAQWTDDADTSVKVAQIDALQAQLQALPEGFILHPRVGKMLVERAQMASGDRPLDWGFAESMAYATLISEGYSVRLSGQDSGRGTFSHRHATLKNQRIDETYVPLRSIGRDPNQFLIIDSLLSEEAVLGFEYGYATTEPKALVIWEAQFGDFANGAQVVIDQFISSGETKWRRLCGLTLFLPHGHEGQGPEHSSARLERYLQLCAEHNMQVCVPTTPAQFFHVLRRQMIRSLRRPLILMTPKSLLRHKRSVSVLEDLTDGSFHPVLDENSEASVGKIERIVLCTGKVYFDLVNAKEESLIESLVLIRIEQLHPFPKNALHDVFARYSNAKTIVWCQEEPKNQGSWYQIQHHIQECLASDQILLYVGRESSPSPAVGYYRLHQEQQQALIAEAIDTRCG